MRKSEGDSQHRKSPPRKSNHSLAMRNLKDAIGKLSNLVDTELLERTEDLINRTPRQALPVPRIDIDPRRREKSLGKIRHHPLVVVVVDMAEAQTFPVRACDSQSALAAPVPGTGVTGCWGVDAMDRFDFVGADGLVPHQVVDLGHPR